MNRSFVKGLVEVFEHPAMQSRLLACVSSTAAGADTIFAEETHSRKLSRFIILPFDRDTTWSQVQEPSLAADSPLPWSLGDRHHRSSVRRFTREWPGRLLGFIHKAIGIGVRDLSRTEGLGLDSLARSLRILWLLDKSQAAAFDEAREIYRQDRLDDQIKYYQDLLERSGPRSKWGKRIALVTI